MKNAASSYGCRTIYYVTSEVTKGTPRDYSRICGALRVNQKTLTQLNIS